MQMSTPHFEINTIWFRFRRDLFLKGLYLTLITSHIEVILLCEKKHQRESKP